MSEKSVVKDLKSTIENEEREDENPPNLSEDTERNDDAPLNSRNGEDFDLNKPPLGIDSTTFSQNDILRASASNDFSEDDSFEKPDRLKTSRTSNIVPKILINTLDNEQETQEEQITVYSSDEELKKKNILQKDSKKEMMNSSTKDEEELNGDDTEGESEEKPDKTGSSDNLEYGERKRIKKKEKLRGDAQEIFLKPPDVQERRKKKRKSRNLQSQQQTTMESNNAAWRKAEELASSDEESIDGKMTFSVQWIIESDEDVDYGLSSSELSESAEGRRSAEDGGGGSRQGVDSYESSSSDELSLASALSTISFDEINFAANSRQYTRTEPKEFIDFKAYSRFGEDNTDVEDLEASETETPQPEIDNRIVNGDSFNAAGKTDSTSVRNFYVYFPNQIDSEDVEKTRCVERQREKFLVEEKELDTSPEEGKSSIVTIKRVSELERTKSISPYFRVQKLLLIKFVNSFMFCNKGISSVFTVNLIFNNLFIKSSNCLWMSMKIFSSSKQKMNRGIRFRI